MVFCDFTHYEIVYAAIGCRLCEVLSVLKEAEQLFTKTQRARHHAENQRWRLEEALKTLENQHANCPKHS